MRIEKLPTLMQDALNTLKDIHNAPIGLTLPAVLGVMNLAVQHRYNVKSELFGNIPISLYLLGIAPTAAAKTTIYKQVASGIEKFEAEEAIRYTNEMASYELSEAIYKTKVRAYQKAMIAMQEDDERDIENMKAAATKDMAKEIKEISEAIVAVSQRKAQASIQSPTKPPMPRSPKVAMTKGTVNGIIKALKYQPSLGLASSEAGEFFNSHAFQGIGADAKAIEMSAVLTTAWDGGKVEKNTGEETVELRNRRMNMMFLLQETVVREFLSNPVFSDQGFVHRILISKCEQYEKPDMDIVSDAFKQKMDIATKRLSEFDDRIYSLISDKHFKDSSSYCVKPKLLEMNEDAKQLAQDFYNSTKQIGETSLKEYAGFSYRLFEHLLRLAGTIAAFNMPLDNRDDVAYINKEDMEAAIELLEFFIDCRKNLEIEAVSNDPQLVKNSELLVDWIIEHKFDGTKRELTKRWPNRFRKLTQDEKQKLISEVCEDLRIAVIASGKTFRITSTTEDNQRMLDE